jgi:hypothetical protein
MAGRAGALRSWANTSDRPARTQPARDAFLERFDGEADPAEARREYMQALAKRSAQVRRQKTRARDGQPDAAQEDNGCAIISRDYRDRADAPAGGPA